MDHKPASTFESKNMNTVIGLMKTYKASEL